MLFDSLRDPTLDDVALPLPHSCASHTLSSGGEEVAPSLREKYHATLGYVQATLQQQTQQLDKLRGDEAAWKAEREVLQGQLRELSGAFAELRKAAVADPVSPGTWGGARPRVRGLGWLNCILSHTNPDRSPSQWRRAEQD